MRKQLTILMFLLVSGTAWAGIRDTLEFSRPDSTLVFSDEYLDTVSVHRQKDINDYSLIGLNYGYTFSSFIFNPVKTNAVFTGRPNYISLMYTHYSKMFDVLPYCGFVIGAQFGHEGFTFKADDDGWISDVDGATHCTLTVIQIPAMCQIHVDFDPCKIMVNLGVYGGYRTAVERGGGPDFETEFARSFRSYERRFDYGLQGGLGFGIMFDPIEIHFNCMALWGWSSLYAPDYVNPKYHKDPQYYYRYATPIDIVASVGINFQLSKRKGKTTSEIRKEAKKRVYGEIKDN
ncbi:MAG: PorT family protein [Bacteroidales bacterium]|nr:PorT family protein [Bacteroidales bacterium]